MATRKKKPKPRAEQMTEGARLLQCYLQISGIPNQRLADRLGVTAGQVSHYLCGMSRPTLDKAHEIQRRIGIPAMTWAMAPDV